MRRKIDVADVEAATKIRAKYLRALENEEFGLLPGNTFVKTFLRTYAEYLGLDPQLLLEEYRASYEPRGEELQPYAVASRQRRSSREPPRRARASGPPGPGTALIVVAGVILVIFAILGLTSGETDDGGSSPSGQAQDTTPTTPEKTRRERPRVTIVRLRIAPSAATYLCVDRGPGTDVVYEETTTEPVTFRGRRVRVNAGTSSIRMSVNGKQVRIEPTPDPIGYDFRLRDGKVSTDELPLGQRPCA